LSPFLKGSSVVEGFIAPTTEHHSANDLDSSMFGSANLGREAVEVCGFLGQGNDTLQVHAPLGHFFSNFVGIGCVTRAEAELHAGGAESMAFLDEREWIAKAGWIGGGVEAIRVGQHPQSGLRLGGEEGRWCKGGGGEELAA